MALRIPGVVVEMTGDFSKLQEDLKQARVVIARDAEGMSNALNNAFSPNQLKGSINELVRNLQKVSAASKVAGSAFDNIGVDLGELRKITGLTEKQFAELQSRMMQTKATQQTERAFQSIARSANLSQAEMIRLRRSMGDLEGATRLQSQLWRENMTGAMNKARAAAFNLQSALLALGAANMVRGIYKTGMEIEKLNIAFDSITGSASATKEEFGFLHKAADDLGQNFYVLAAGYKGIAAAAKGTNLEGAATRDIFLAITEASTALGMSSDATDRSLKAIAQIMSKGKLSAEELRQQLGDHLYGAFNKAAEAMGVTTAALDKMLKDGAVPAAEFIPKFAAILHRDFGEAARKSAGSAQAAVNKFAEAWIDLENTMATSGFMDSATDSLRNISAMLKDPAVLQSISDLGKETGELVERMTDVGAAAGDAFKIVLDGWNALPEPVQAVGLVAALFGGAAAVGLISVMAYEADSMMKAIDAWRKGQISTVEMIFSTGTGLDSMLDEVARKERDLVGLNEQISDLVARRNTTVYKDEQDALDKQIASLEYRKTLLVEATSASFSGRGDNSTGLKIIAPKLPSTQNTVLDANATKKAVSALQAVNDEIARMTMNEKELAQYNFSKQVKEWEAALGKANPALAEYVRLKERELKLAELAKLSAYEISELERMNRGDSFFGKADAQKRAEAILKEKEKELEKLAKLESEAAEERQKLAEKETEELRKQWERVTERIDDTMVEIWSDFFDGGRNAMQSVTRLFKSMLAEWANMAITRPIILPIMASVGSSLGFPTSASAGSAGSAGSASNLMGSVPWSSMMPEGMTSGITGSINAWGASTMPSVFAANSGATSAYLSSLAASTSSPAASLAAAEAAMTAPSATLMGTLGAAGVAGGIGMFVGNLVAPDNPNVGYGAGAGAAAGAAIGSIIPGVGTVIGGIVGGVAGGGLGSLFGGGKKTSPSILVEGNELTFGETPDMSNWHSKGGNEDGPAIQATLEQIASSVLGGIETTIAGIGEEYAQKLDGQSFWFGHPKRYDFGTDKDYEALFAQAGDDIFKEALETAQDVVLEAGEHFVGSEKLLKAKDLLADADGEFAKLVETIESGLGDGGIVDYYTELQKLQLAVSTTVDAWDGVQNAITAVLSPMSEYEVAMRAANAQVDAWIAGLKALGIAEEHLLEVEAQRRQVVDATAGLMMVAFRQDKVMRLAQMTGNDDLVAATRLAIAHEQELAEARKKWGAGSAQYFDLQVLQSQEQTSLLVQQQLTSAQRGFDEAKGAYLSALQEQASGLRSTTDGLKRMAEAMRALRESLLLDSALSPLSIDSRYQTAGASLDALFTRAMAGDQDAMEQLQDTSRKYLEASLAYNADFDAYRTDFDRVQSLLRSVEAEATTQGSIADLQLQALEREIAVIQGVGDSVVGSLDSLKAAFLASQTALEEALRHMTQVQSHASSGLTGTGANPSTGSTGSSGSSGGSFEYPALPSKDASQAVIAAYREILGRNPDFGGLDFYAGQIDSGRSIVDVRADLEWAKLHGAKARGGYAGAGMWLVGEEGPEIIDLATPGRVYTASETAEALRGGGTAGLAEELRALRTEVQQLQSVIDRGLYAVADNTQRTAQVLRKFDGDGMPAVREN